MRFISLALAVSVSMSLATATTQASSPLPARHAGTATLLRDTGRAFRPVHLVLRTLRRHVEPHSVTHSRSQQSVQTLALAAGAYAPAVINQQYNGSITAATADQSWFSTNHTPNSSGIYEAFGYVFGWYQRADWTGTNPITSFRYQGMKMSSVQGAKNGWSDGIAYTSSQSGGTAQQCSNDPANFGCEYLDYTYTSSGTGYTERYVDTQLGACMAEMTGTMPTANVSASSSTLVQVLNQMISAAITAMQNTCGGGGNPPPTAVPTTVPTSIPTAVPTATIPSAKTEFSVVSVRFEKAGSQPDWNLKNNPLTRVKAGTMVRMSLYVDITSLAPGAGTPSVEFLLKRNGKTISDKTYTASAVTAGDTYRFHPPSDTKLSKAGAYTLEAGIRLDNKTDSAQSQLRAVQKYVAPKPVSFSLTNVSVGSGTIHANQQVTIHIGFVVRNLKGNVTGYLTRTLLANINGQWKGVSTSTSSTLVQNGQNNQVMTTQINTPGHYQWLIAVTVGASTQRKTVPITVL